MLPFLCRFLQLTLSEKPDTPTKKQVCAKHNNKNKTLHTTDITAAIPRREQAHGLAPLGRLALEAPLPERRELVVPITPPPRPVPVTPSP